MAISQSSWAKCVRIPLTLRSLILRKSLAAPVPVGILVPIKIDIWHLPGFSLSIIPAEGSPNQTATTFYATDVENIGMISGECKRLRKIAGRYICSTAKFVTSEIENPATVNTSESTSQFNWLQPYTSQHIHIPVRQSSDLRNHTTLQC